MDIQDVDLDDIERVSVGDLEQSRLDNLEDGYDDFETVLNSSSDPITLDASFGIPYSIVDGRHRIYIARERGYSSVPAFIQGGEDDE